MDTDETSPKRQRSIQVQIRLSTEEHARIEDLARASIPRPVTVNQWVVDAALRELHHQEMQLCAKEDSDALEATLGVEAAARAQKTILAGFSRALESEMNSNPEFAAVYQVMKKLSGDPARANSQTERKKAK